MKFKSTLFLIITAISLCIIMALPLGAESVISGTLEESNISYEITSDNKLLITGTGSMPDFVVTETPWYTYSQSISEVTISSGITSIGANAFVSINAPISIPDSVSSIGANALGFNYENGEYIKISSFTISAKSGSCASEYATQNGFTFNQTDLQDITGNISSDITFTLTPSGILTFHGSGEIPADTILNASLSDYKDGNGNYVIKEIIIPSTITSIGKNAFDGCSSLLNLTLSDGVTSIDDGAFSNCTSLESVLFPTTLISIGNEAFSFCTSLSSVTLNNNLQYIGSKAFELTALTSVTLPSSLVEAGESIFFECKSLLEATINSTFVPTLAFSDCTSLRTVTLSTNTTTINSNAFDGCTALTTINSSSSLKSIGSYAFKNCKSLISLDFNNSVETYGEYCFLNCSSIVSYTFPDTVNSIPEGMFYGCTSLASVQLGDGIEAIGDFAFIDCTALNSLFVSFKVRVLGNYCIGYSFGGIEFDENNEAQNVYLPIDMDIEGFSPSYALKYAEENNIRFTQYKIVESDTGDVCEGITWIFKRSIGSLSLIGKGLMPDYLSFDHTPWAIYKDLIRQVTFSTGIENIGTSSFEGCYAIEKIDISSTIKTIGAYAFADTGLSGITIPSGVVEIGESAFQGCESLYTLTLPTTLQIVGNSAFKGPNILSSVFIPESVITIGEYAFGMNENDQTVIGYVIKGIEGSSAQSYAAQNGIKFLINGYIEIVNKETGAKISMPGMHSLGYALNCSTIANTLEPQIIIHPAKSVVVYNLTLTENGMETMIDGEAVITLPIPAGLENDILYIYQLGTNGFPMLIEHIRQDGMLVFSHGSLGNFIVTNCELTDLYTITINYSYSDGKPVKETVTILAVSGAQYRFTADVISKYTVNKGSFAGTVTNENIVIDFIYTASSTSNGNQGKDQNDGLSMKFLLIIILVILIIALIAASLLFVYMRKKKKKEELETKRTIASASKKPTPSGNLEKTIIVPDFATREINIQSLFADDPEEDFDAEEQLRKMLDTKDKE